MKPRLNRTQRQMRRKGRKRPLLLLMLGILAGTAGAYAWKEYVPNWRHEAPDFGGNGKPVFYNGEMLEQPAIGQQDSLKLSFDLVKEWIDPAMIHEPETDSTIITTEDKVVRLRTSELTGMINEKPIKLQFPLEKTAEGKLYLPADPLKELYGIELRESPETGAVLMFKEGDAIRWGRTAVYDDKPAKTIPMRKAPDIKAPILADLKQDEELIVWGEEGEWLRVQLGNGHRGFVRSHQITDLREEVIPQQEPRKKYDPWKPKNGEKINLTWEHVVSKNPDTAKIPAMAGLHVVSPTWFHLRDGDGNLSNLASAEYVKWAHSRNYQVWALFSNGFDPERTTEALATYDSRMKMIKQLLAFSELYSLQGINIDFENVNIDDKQKLVQFVREFTPLAHEQGLVVSIDVTPKSTSASWSMFYDRPALIESVDYMMLMAYDEHWATSPKAGSVASLPWVENSVRRLLEEDGIPPSKLLLGVPFYTRVWTEEKQDGKTKVSSRAIYMDTAQRIIREKNLKTTFDKAAGQNYVEYEEDGKLHKIWLEDEVSVKARIDLVHKYDLAGIASWRRGFENPQAWQWIDDTLQP